MNTASEKHLAEVYPGLASRARAAAEACSTPTYTVEFYQGVRTWAQQQELWNKGRDAQGNIIDPKQIVTHARPGQSYHQVGLSLDFFIEENGQAVWSTTHPGYEAMVAAAEAQGLVSGSRWPEPKTDFDHLQLTGRFPENEPDSYCLYLFKEGGMAAVWAEVDKALGEVSAT